jgi:UDP-N-acetylmuramoyl-L-alanyl-D-glutamate--2,6-diaminopimelate ligase
LKITAFLEFNDQKKMRKLKNLCHLVVAYFFQALYRFPARRLRVIGITGTDGKTTTASFIFHVLTTAGRRASVLTTVSAHVGGVSYDTGFHVTTPHSSVIAHYLAKSAAHGDEFFVFEITSHGLDQNRAAGVGFEVAGITNITHEHLGYHKTFDEYVRAKAKIATLSKLTYLNADQPDIVAKIKRFQPHAAYATFGLEKPADVSFSIEERFGRKLERYNCSNFLLAYAICKHLGISDDHFGEAVRSYTFPPGRMEVVHNSDLVVISDFAHTPNSIDQALLAIREKYPGRRIIHVFGAAAHRDDSKREAMGYASGMRASTTILTEEDYRDEDPERIFRMLAEGLVRAQSQFVPKHAYEGAYKTFTSVLPREEAIRQAILMAREGDVIVVTGKAHEKSLCRGKTEYPYDEKQAIFNALNERSQGFSPKLSEHEESAKHCDKGHKPERESDGGTVV